MAEQLLMLPSSTLHSSVLTPKPWPADASWQHGGDPHASRLRCRRPGGRTPNQAQFQFRGKAFHIISEQAIPLAHSMGVPVNLSLLSQRRRGHVTESLGREGLRWWPKEDSGFLDSFQFTLCSIKNRWFSLVLRPLPSSCQKQLVTECHFPGHTLKRTLCRWTGTVGCHSADDVLNRKCLCLVQACPWLAWPLTLSLT